MNFGRSQKQWSESEKFLVLVEGGPRAQDPLPQKFSPTLEESLLVTYLQHHSTSKNCWQGGQEAKYMLHRKPPLHDGSGYLQARAACHLPGGIETSYTNAPHCVGYIIFCGNLDLLFALGIN